MTTVPLEQNIEAWKAWDWTKQDVALAELHSISRERVRQIRRVIGAPKSYNYRRKRRAIPCDHKPASA